MNDDIPVFRMYFQGERFVDADFSETAANHSTSISSYAWTVQTGSSAVLNTTPVNSGNISQCEIKASSDTAIWSHTLFSVDAYAADGQVFRKYFKIDVRNVT